MSSRTHEFKGDHLYTIRDEMDAGLTLHTGPAYVSDKPVLHAGLRSSVTHHQTADALAYLPRLTNCPDEATAAAAADETDCEEVLLSDGQWLSVYRLCRGQVRGTMCIRVRCIAGGECVHSALLFHDLQVCC